MAYTSPRKKLHTDVVPFPDTKSASEATLSSDVLRDFETTGYGPLNLHLVAADSSLITDDIDIEPYVSFDNGSTWIQAGDFTDLANGTGSISVLHSLNYIPRVRVDAYFSGSTELAEGHGVKVHAEMAETMPEYRHDFTANVDNLGDTLGTGTTVTGQTIELPASTDKLAVIVKADDLSNVTDNVTYMLQSSYDGVYWWDMWASAQTDVANGTGILYAEHDMDSGEVVGNYARVNFTSDGTGELTSGHGVAANLLAFAR